MRDELLYKIDKLVTNPETSESDVDHFMTLIRKLKERTHGNSESYPLLDFFCDWTKHTSLDRNAEGHQIIIELNEQLFNLKDKKDNNTLIEGISKVISFERLQAELAAFLTYYGLPVDIVTKKNLWLRYVIHLVNIVSDCPLELPENRRDRIKNSIKNGAVAISLKYKWVNSGVFSQNRTISKEDTLTLIISMSDTTTIVLPCKILGKYLTAKNNQINNE